MFEDVGIANSARDAVAVFVGASVLPTLFVQWKGDALRRDKTVPI